MGSEHAAGGAYHQATDFMVAARLLDAEVGAGAPEQLRLVAPSIVCTAFAIELFFKSMLALAGAPSKGHNLRTLFNRLDDLTKDRLRAALNCSAETFDGHLARVSMAFTDWRYAHERRTLSIELGFIRGLCKAAVAEAERHLTEHDLKRLAVDRSGAGLTPGTDAD